MDTPVPMPNTEVKHRSGDDSRKRQKQHAASLSGPQGDSFFFAFLQCRQERDKVTAAMNASVRFTCPVSQEDAFTQDVIMISLFTATVIS